MGALSACPAPGCRRSPGAGTSCGLPRRAECKRVEVAWRDLRQAAATWRSGRSRSLRFSDGSPALPFRGVASGRCRTSNRPKVRTDGPETRGGMWSNLPFMSRWAWVVVTRLGTQVLRVAGVDVLHPALRAWICRCAPPRVKHSVKQCGRNTSPRAIWGGDIIGVCKKTTRKLGTD